MLFMRQQIAMLGGKKHAGILFRNKVMHLVNMIASVFSSSCHFLLLAFYVFSVFIKCGIEFSKKRKEFFILFSLITRCTRFSGDENNCSASSFLLLLLYRLPRQRMRFDGYCVK